MWPTYVARDARPEPRYIDRVKGTYNLTVEMFMVMSSDPCRVNYTTSATV